MIYLLIFVVQVCYDYMINIESVNIIYNEVEIDDKQLKWYEELGYVIMLDKEWDFVYQDVYEFLEKFDW